MQSITARTLQKTPRSTMKTVLVLAALVAVALAAPQQSSKDAVVVKYDSDNIGVDGYKFSFETSDGVSRSEVGELKNAGTENEAMVVRGVISWIGADGTPYKMEFTADETGFHPVGDHLPK